ncbi:MAG TPA: hypothetical protein VF817_03815 [Patescibacteria group bacterium]
MIFFFQKNIKKHPLFWMVGAWLLVLLLIGIFSQNLSSYSGLRTCYSRLYSPYYRWDSSWYTQIAQKGYSFSTEKNSSIAYWPLYPATIKFFHALNFTSFAQSGPILSIAYAIGAFLMLYKLVLIDYSKKTSLYILAVVMLFPPAYFFVSGYPESLFLLLVVLSFYFARKQRWLLAGIFSALLSLVKPYGILMMPALLFEYVIANDWDWKIFFKKISWTALLLPLATFGSFVLYNYLKFNNALAFLATQKSWGRSLGNPISNLLAEAKDYVTPPAKLLTGYGFPYVIYVASFFFFLWAMYISWSRVRKSYLLFTFLVMLAAFLTGTLTSWDRYMMTSLASLIGVGVYFSEKKYWNWAYLIASGILFLSLASLFVRCFPVE